MASDLFVKPRHPSEVMSLVCCRLNGIWPCTRFLGNVLLHAKICITRGQTWNALLRDEHHFCRVQPGRVLHCKTYRFDQGNGFYAPTVRDILSSNTTTLCRWSGDDLSNPPVMLAIHGSSAAASFSRSGGATKRKDGSYGGCECGEDIEPKRGASSDGLVSRYKQVLDCLHVGGSHEGKLRPGDVEDVLGPPNAGGSSGGRKMTGERKREESKPHSEGLLGHWTLTLPCPD